VDKFNIRLTRASQYLSQFELDIRYTPGKDYLIPNAIFRFVNKAIGEKKTFLKEKEISIFKLVILINFTHKKFLSNYTLPCIEQA
jgi:hypothetical protein